jgi:urea transport system ATP-binding protein
MAIVLVEQYFDFAFDLADSIVVLRRGEVAFSGRKADLARQDVLEAVSV